MAIDALRPDNQFRFVCPIFGAESEFTDCLEVHTRFMRGDRVAGRGACQACMSAGKCPLPDMVKETLVRPTAYFSAQPKLGSISGSTLEKIAPVGFFESLWERFAVTAEEKAAMIASAGVAQAKRTGKAMKRVARSVAATVQKPAAESPADDVPAAANDLAGAITAAVAAERGSGSASGGPGLTAAVATPEPEVTAQAAPPLTPLDGEILPPGEEPNLFLEEMTPEQRAEVEEMNAIMEDIPFVAAGPALVMNRDVAASIARGLEQAVSTAKTAAKPLSLLERARMMRKAQ